MPVLEKSGAKIIGIISHLGFDEDKKLAKLVPKITFIIGGHSHTTIKKPAIVNGTFIVQAGSRGRYLGKLILEIDPKTGDVTLGEGSGLIPVLNENIRPDPNVGAVVQKYASKVKTQMSKIIGMAEEDLGNDDSTESPLGNLITDALREKTGTVAAFYNAGGIRAPIYKGPITLGDIYTVLPFDNAIVSMDLTGREILEVLEHGVSGEHGLIQVSGVVFSYNPAKPKGSRVGRVQIGGRDLDLNSTYRIGTVDFLALGGDGYESFKKGRNILYGPLNRDVFTEYVQKKQKLSAPQGGRIIKE
jgi:2',3'-cyclic-nucleotide 2'-phosphodiesterase (5'-nucleotidase family)